MSCGTRKTVSVVLACRADCFLHGDQCLRVRNYSCFGVVFSLVLFALAPGVSGVETVCVGTFTYKRLYGNTT